MVYHIVHILRGNAEQYYPYIYWQYYYHYVIYHCDITVTHKVAKTFNLFDEVKKNVSRPT